MTINDIAIMLTGIVEAIMIFTLFETFCTKRENIPFGVYIVGVIALAIMINISNTIFKFGSLNIVGMIAASFIISFLYRGKIYLRAIISVFGFLIVTLIELLVMFGITSIYGITVADTVNIPEYRLLGIVISKSLALLIVNIIRVRFKNNSFYANTSYWALIFFMFASATATIFLIFKLSYDVGNRQMYNLSIICSLGTMFSTFFSLYLYERLSKQSDIIKKQQQYEQHLKDQVKHLDEILVSQNQIKKFKHDFSNYMIGLKAYLNDDNSAEAKKYLDKLSQKFYSAESSIETGNPALDAILNTKKALAESKNIKFDAKIQIPENIAVDPIDICIIFGNALDNAIEACDRIKDNDKKILLTMAYQNESLYCKITNTAQVTEKKKLTTSKTDKRNHGFGLDNIKTVLKKYNSEPSIEYKDNQFILKFVIFIQ